MAVHTIQLRASDAASMPHSSDDERFADAKVTSDPLPRRVLYVLSQFPSLSETFIVRELQTLIDRGVDVRILSLKSSREQIVQPQAAAMVDRVLYPAGSGRTLLAVFATLLRQPAVTLAFLAMTLLEFWRRPVILAKSLGAIFRALGRIDDMRAFAPQLIHAPWATYPATVAWLLSRLLRRPFSFTSRAHDIFIEDHMMARKLANAALAVTITEYNRHFMARWMTEPGAIPVRVIHSSLNLSELPFVQSGRLPRKLLSVGRLVPMKGFDILLAALAELRARGLELSCTVIGEGPERGRLEKLRAALGLDTLVEFPGAMPQSEVVRRMGESTLMVLPCVVAPNGQSDGIPNVLMESMATGLPVISTRISGIPELVQDGVNGRLVPAGDVAALADAVEALLEDPDQCEAFALAGRHTVESDFDVRIEAGRLLEHFGSVCHV
jgi:glycosyltransferase involved in cell wall biosynthesis